MALSTNLRPVDAVLLLRVTAVLCVVPAAFALDDPAANTTAMSPDDRVAQPMAGLSLEAVASGAATVLLSVLGLRLTGGERGSVVAAPGSVLLPLVLVLALLREQRLANSPVSVVT